MEREFFNAIKTYFRIIEDACNMLIKHIERSEKIFLINKFDLYDYFNRSHKYAFDLGDRKYHMHGNGMSVVCNNIVIADWNFGYRSWWCGIDPFLMAMTLKNNKYKIRDYHNGNYIRVKCENYMEKGLLYYYKNQYYINMIKLGATKIEFPMEYDKMNVEYKGVTRSFLKCKSIDRFIRKSNSIYEGISALPNNFILIFYKNDREVARIPYNDIAYPDSAVKIMNKEIIKPHIVEKWKVKKDEINE